MEQTENIQTPISPDNNVQNPHFSTKKLMIGIVLVLVLATVFVLGMGYESKSNRVNIIEKKPVKTVETVNNDMEGWNIYKDDKYKFQTKYNPQSTPVINPLNKNTSLKLISFGTNFLTAANGYEIRIGKKHFFGDSELKSEMLNNFNTERIDSTTHVNINGISWTKLNFRIFMSTDYVSLTSAMVNINENGFTITASSSEIDKILSTFEFFLNDKEVTINFNNPNFPDSIVPEDMQLAIKQAVEKRPVNIFPNSSVFNITSSRIEGDWALFSIAAFDGPCTEQYGAGECGTMLLVMKDLGMWKAAIRGTKQFAEILNKAPESFISSEAKTDLVY